MLSSVMESNAEYDGELTGMNKKKAKSGGVDFRS